jgi:hypothetical protein
MDKASTNGRPSNDKRTGDRRREQDLPYAGDERRQSERRKNPS